MRFTGSAVGCAAVFLVSCTLLACVGAEAEEEDVEVKTDEIFGANPVTGRGAICIKKSKAGNCCTGSVLNNQIIMTSAHCLADSSFNGYREVWINYQGPNGPRNWEFSNAGGVDNRMFMYVHPNWSTANNAPEWDMAIGALEGTQSLGLDEMDFVTIYKGSLKENMGLTVAGYGGSLNQPSNIQRRAGIRMTWTGSHHVKWEKTVLGQMLCPGDSGGPGLRNSGYQDGLGRYWDAQATIHKSVFGSNADCGSDGRATRVGPKAAWINDIVEFWTPWTCSDFTNPAGEKAAWCWSPVTP